MKRYFIASCLVAAFLLAGCTSGTSTSVRTTPDNINRVAAYKGKKARIAVLSFKCKATKCSGQIGSGISDMLQDALMQSGRFIVLERGSEISEIQKERSFGVPIGSAGGPLERADIAVTGAIVAFEPNAGGFGVGVGGFLPKVPLIGGVKVGKKDAYVAAIIKLVDVRTGRILSSTRVEGKASSFKIGGVGGGIFGRIPLGIGLEEYQNTPMEKAVMVMIDNAVKAISENIPENYYRYSSIGEPVPSATTSQTQPAGSQAKSEMTIGKVFKEDFETYGLGQMIPFGPWQGKDVKITQVVQKDGRIGKVAEFLFVPSGPPAKMCLAGKFYKNFDITFDHTAGGYKGVGIVFRASENPPAGYKVIFEDRRVKVFKFAGNSNVKIAENSISNFKPVNGWYTVHLRVEGNRIKAFINDEMAIDIADNDPALNRPGLLCIEKTNVDPTDVDNIEIIDLE